MASCSMRSASMIAFRRTILCDGIAVFVAAALADLHQELEPYYSDIGRPSVDPELMIRMLIVGYCCGIRSERRLTQEVELHLAYRWFCKLDLDDEIPHHSTFSANRLGRFRESDVLRHVFERGGWGSMNLSGGEVREAWGVARLKEENPGRWMPGLLPTLPTRSE